MAREREEGDSVQLTSVRSSRTGGGGGRGRELEGGGGGAAALEEGGEKQLAFSLTQGG